MTEIEDATSLSDVLARIARELRRMHVAGQEIEEAVGGQIRNGRLPTGTMHLSLQRLDLLVQSLDGLALFIGHIADDLGVDPRIDPREAARRVVVRDLAHSLGGMSRARRIEEDSASGHVQLF